MADDKTIQDYIQNAQKYIDEYERKFPKKLYELASIYFKPLGVTLDIGAGTGRDSYQLSKMNFSTTAVEPVPEFGHHIQTKYPQIKIIKDQLPELKQINNNSVDNIFCCGVLSHIPANELLSSLSRLLELLHDEGTLILSWRNSTNNTEREADRLFSQFSGLQVVDILSSYGCETVYYRYDYPDETRPNVPFYTLVVKKKSKALQGLAKIQSIIANDSKTSTYKLALIRALAEIAQSESFCVKYSENFVLVPLNKISKLWVYYYWMLALQDIKQGSNANLAVYNELVPFAKNMKMPSGNYYSDTDSNQEIINLEKSIQKIIINQPVKYITENSEQVFKVEKLSKEKYTLKVPEDIWCDLVLFGHWIEKSLLLEWAKITYRLNQQNKSLGYYLDLLMYNFDGKRDLSVIKTVKDLIIENGTITKCSWSQKPLNLKSFDIDHMIPFSGGYIEHMWNLVPADPKINNTKRDKIPTAEQITKSFSNIVECWKIYEKKCPERFSREFKEGLNLDVSDLDKSVSKDALIERTSHQVNIKGGVYWR